MKLPGTDLTEHADRSHRMIDLCTSPILNGGKASISLEERPVCRRRVEIPRFRANTDYETSAEEKVKSARSMLQC